MPSHPAIPAIIRRRQTTLAALVLGIGLASAPLFAKQAPPPTTPEDIRTLEIIHSHRPSVLKTLPPDFNDRHGATHSDGKYYFTDKPFLEEGAERILEIGTRLGKFWFDIPSAKKFYSFNSEWPESKTLIDLANTPYFQKVWDMPFRTILLNTTTPSEEGWRKRIHEPEFSRKISQDYYDLAAFFYEKFRDRPVTVIFQNWEGDWMLRGIGKEWTPPPEDWELRCERMRLWIAAKQEGVNRARRDFAGKSQCVVAHAVEVNRVADAWKGIPNVTRNVLPGVEVDLVSYSAYDGINQGDPIRFWKCIDEIRDHIKTGPLFGPGAIMVGEFGIAENVSPERVRERCDEIFGVMLAKGVLFSAYWEIFCNEFAAKKEDIEKSPPALPVKDEKLLRGFYLVKPDGTLSKAGNYLRDLWNRPGPDGAAAKETPKARAWN